MISDTIVRSMDTIDDGEISVSISKSVYADSAPMVVLADTSQIPYRRIYLSVTEARKLAEFLTEQAAEAEALDA